MGDLVEVLGAEMGRTSGEKLMKRSKWNNAYEKKYEIYEFQ